MTRILTILVLATAAWSQPVLIPRIDPLTQPLDCWCPVSVTLIKDADTVRGTVHLPFGVALIDESLRPEGWDAWEASKRRDSEAAGEITDAEVLKGKKAKRELEELLKDGTLYVRPSAIRSRDNYGRLLCHWRVVSGFKVIEMQEYAARKGWLRTKAGE